MWRGLPSIWASKALPSSRAACSAGALWSLPMGTSTFLKEFRLAPFLGRPSSAILGNAAIAECLVRHQHRQLQM